MSFVSAQALRVVGCVAALLACATPPYLQPFPANVVAPGSGEEVGVAQVILLFDSSDSIGDVDDFPSDKALLESFVAGMPDGGYLAGAINFGGSLRQSAVPQPFARPTLAGYARELRHLGRGTPLEDVLRELPEAFATKLAPQAFDSLEGRFVVVLFSDGSPTVQGVPRSGKEEIQAARDLVARHRGTVCIHTVRTGQLDDRRAFLEALSKTTDCGSHWDASSLGDASSLAAAQRQMFVTKTVVPTVDSDRDGVGDPTDACPATPFGADVDPRGCWVLSDLRFSTDSSEIDPADVSRVDAIAVVLQVNPLVRVRIEGHTDSTGGAAYNQALSERRAQTVETYLVGRGVDRARLEAEGFGETKPAASNETEDGRGLNRRIEFSVLR